MGYSEELAQRTRGMLALTYGIDERALFGGLEFLLLGTMVCGVVGDDLVVHVGPHAYEDSLGRPGARALTRTGQAAVGVVHVDGAAVDNDIALRAWVRLGLSYVKTLPPKVEPPPVGSIAS